MNITGTIDGLGLLEGFEALRTDKPASRCQGKVATLLAQHDSRTLNNLGYTHEVPPERRFCGAKEGS